MAMPDCSQAREAPRGIGRHYTPRELARRMVRACLDALPAGDGPCRVLDPACGNGAFVLETFDELCIRRASSTAAVDRIEPVTTLAPAARRDVARECIFGVDIDDNATRALRQSLLGQISETQRVADTRRILSKNIRTGDALTAPGWTRGENDSARAGGPRRGKDSVAIDWARDFPAVADAGGFDLVIGNPPYVRERDAKPLFDRIASSDLGQRWRQGRMDLWHYFVHRGLDLLRPGGLLCFVVSSYWTGSQGASRLIERLRLEAAFEEIELLGTERLFAGVSGRHMIFRVRRRRTQLHTGESVCRIRGSSGSLSGAQPARSSVDDGFVVPHSELFHEGRLVLTPPDRLSQWAANSPCLAAECDCRQGIAENPPRINRRLQSRYGSQFVPGEGVFVLSPPELERLALSSAERELLRPYYETAALGRFCLPASPTHSILYLTPKTAPSIERLPAIAAHLARYRPILEARREVALGRLAWWHLHWPREESIFVRPRILCVQMGRRPQFVWTGRPAFVGFSVNVVLSREADAIDLRALTGILNSNLALAWFERHAKRRGVSLEINGHVLRQFPLPPRDIRRERLLAELVIQRQALEDPRSATETEQEIDAHVLSLYDVPYLARRHSA